MAGRWPIRVYPAWTFESFKPSCGERACRPEAGDTAGRRSALRAGRALASRPNGWRIAMMKWSHGFQRACAALVLVAFVGRPTAQAQRVPVVEKQLTNGMRLLLVERHDEPSVAGGWVAHVGSSNERPGMTGIAHLFEHMMFKGTPTIGTKDYSKDLAIISEQEQVRDQMRAEERKMRALYRHGEIDDLLKPEN